MVVIVENVTIGPEKEKIVEATTAIEKDLKTLLRCDLSTNS